MADLIRNHIPYNSNLRNVSSPENILDFIEVINDSEKFNYILRFVGLNHFNLIFAERKRVDNLNKVDVYIMRSEADLFFSEVSMISSFIRLANESTFDFGTFVVVDDIVHSFLNERYLSQSNLNGDSMTGGALVTSEAGMKLAKYLVGQAIRVGASDLHVIYTSDLCPYYVRYQGERHGVESIPSNEIEEMLRAMLKDAQGTSSQEFQMEDTMDYRLEMVVDQYNVLIRYNQTPGSDKASVVMRLAVTPKEQRRAKDKPFTDLGFPDDQVEVIEATAFTKKGAFLCLGPTASGKTTLASLILLKFYLRSKGTPHMLSAEDPIEIKHDFMLKTDLNEMSDLHTLETLVLRQDIDHFNLGEIRYPKHVTIFEKVTLGAKPMLSTMHVKHPLEAFGKLLDNGAQPNSIFSVGFIKNLAQMNLAQKLCPYCSMTLDEAIACEEAGTFTSYPGTQTPFKVNDNVKNIFMPKDGSENMLSRLGMDSMSFAKKSKIRIRNPKGCEHCAKHIVRIRVRDNSYKNIGTPGVVGLAVISEMLAPNEKLLSIYLSTRNIIKVTHYYETLFRFDSPYDCMAVTMEEHGLKRLLNGEICANYFDEKISQLDTMLKDLNRKDYAIKEALYDNGVVLKSKGGFSLEKYFKNPSLIKQWKKEYNKIIYNNIDAKLGIDHVS